MTWEIVRNAHDWGPPGLPNQKPWVWGPAIYLKFSTWFWLNLRFQNKNRHFKTLRIVKLKRAIGQKGKIKTSTWTNFRFNVLVLGRQSPLIPLPPPPLTLQSISNWPPIWLPTKAKISGSHPGYTLEAPREYLNNWLSPIPHQIS